MPSEFKHFVNLQIILTKKQIEHKKYGKQQIIGISR